MLHATTQSVSNIESIIMEQWLSNQCNTFTNTYRTFSIKRSGSDSESLIDDSSTIAYKILENEPKTKRQSSFKKTFSIKTKSKEKSEPVLPPVLQTYNKSLFDNSWL